MSEPFYLQRIIIRMCAVTYIYKKIKYSNQYIMTLMLYSLIKEGIYI